MPATATYTPTGNAYVDGVLSGIKWGVSSLTFSFPNNSSYYGSSYGSGEQLSNFDVLNTVQQNAVRDALKMYAGVANIAFTEVTETASVHGDLRYAQSDLPGTAWAYYPSTNAAGGDAWFNNSTGWYDNPLAGNYAWATMLHETGHALGLKHPHQASGSFGVLPTDNDSLEYSIMSYRSYVGASTSTGYTNGSTSFPQTLMMYDIAAMQKMYGANYSTNAGDTVYSWSATTGQMSLNGVGQGAPVGNKIFMTLWDGGGADTYDFSNYATAVTVDLNPGGWTTTSSAQLASLGGGKVAVGNIANALLYNNNPASLIEHAIGGAGNDSISGNVADNALSGGRGNDTLDGRGGTDTAVYSGVKSDYSWTLNSNGSWSIADLRSSSPDGTDTLKSIEYLRFSDVTVALGGGSPPVDPPNPPPPANKAPVAVADTYNAAKNKTLVVGSVLGVAANDTDANGDSLTVSLVSGSSKGTIKLAADGSFTFAPKKNFTGTTTFKYKVSDGQKTSNTATVTIKVASSSKSTSKKKKKAGGVDHGSIWDDQIPGLAGHSGTGDKPAADDRPHLGSIGSAITPLLSTGGMLDHLIATLSGLGATHLSDVATFDTASDVSSLPDFLAAHASDFGLV